MAPCRKSSTVLNNVKPTKLILQEYRSQTEWKNNLCKDSVKNNYYYKQQHQPIKLELFQLDLTIPFFKN